MGFPYQITGTSDLHNISRDCHKVNILHKKGDPFISSGKFGISFPFGLNVLFYLFLKQKILYLLLKRLYTLKSIIK